eukprot:70394-Chlamydomonas_euryale.AAC.1
MPPLNVCAQPPTHAFPTCLAPARSRAHTPSPPLLNARALIRPPLPQCARAVSRACLLPPQALQAQRERMRAERAARRARERDIARRREFARRCQEQVDERIRELEREHEEAEAARAAAEAEERRRKVEEMAERQRQREAEIEAK